jgi:peptide methionine sulfoxide reductase msrA/msrB
MSQQPGGGTVKEIYLAGGCFWGVQQYFAQIQGVTGTQTGYANGPERAPGQAPVTYEEVCQDAGHVEAVKVQYDPERVPLEFLLDRLFRVIDPLSVNQQGHDVGIQYRTGIYYTDQADALIVDLALAGLQRRHREPIAVESGPLQNFTPAEDYHQDYLVKNPGGYCHISPAAMAEAAQATPPARELKATPDAIGQLTPLQYAVTRFGATERPFTGEYDQHFEPGIYVDITSGQPLFVSTDKYDSGCGWPAFSKPITADVLQELEDLSYGRVRTEVRSAASGAHLGHVFDDGPAEAGGLRYCINSAALRFVPRDQMAAQGYASYLPLVK